IKEFFKNENIEFIGDLLPIADQTKFDVENDTNFQFAFEYGFFPETKIDVAELVVPVYKIKIEDKQIEDEIINLQKKYGDFAEAETTEEKSRFRADFVELNDDNTPKENGVKTEDGLVAIEFVEKTLAKELIGIKKDDKINLDVKKAFTNDTDLAALLKIEKNQLPNVNNKFELTIKTIENYKEGELNQDFFDKLFGKDKVKSEDEMKEKIKEVLSQQYKSEAKIRFRYDLKNALDEKVQMPLPDEFIVKWQMDRRKDETEEAIRKELDSLKKAIIWDRILNLLSKEHNLEIEQKDILDSSKANIINSIAQMGLSTDMFSDEQLDQFANQELERMSENDRYSLIFSTVERKVLNGLYEKVVHEEKEITFDQLKAIYEEENKKIAENNKEEKTENKEISNNE
ncbi:MAG: hypothetical protein JXR68_07610, partial [Bacteroidales bacterium]|nr:hypothetical protein [Bacteroidales bacterium]